MTNSLLTYLSRTCKRQPDSIAVIFKDSSLSYRELDSESSHLASLLHKRGLRPGEPVGIYLDKSPEAIVAIFGILKAGACYVPLDPMAPQARLSLIIDDCKLRFLLTSHAKLKHIQSTDGYERTLSHIFITGTAPDEISNEGDRVDICFCGDQERGSHPDSSLCQTVCKDDLAYILYTSGSTGIPKGVMVSHGAACAFVDWVCETFGLESTETISSHAPLHFDLSIFDIFASIAAGAAIFLVPQGWSAFPKTIADLIEKNRITTWYSVPTVLMQLALHGELEKRDLSSLRRILFAGEVFPSKCLCKLMQLIPHAEYVNLYGPTETNVVTWHQLRELPDPDRDIPIGTLCRGTTGYIVTEAGEKAQPGEMGELYVNGPTLMKGYWGDEQKTRSVLIANPFDKAGQGIVYKTGDLVHQDENGDLIYHGRSDTMIKSRGYRIELQEIETVISSHPDVHESVVTALPSDLLGSQIAAMVVAEKDSELEDRDLRQFCRARLPLYMVPEIIQFTTALPRTSTGKIDRQGVAGMYA